MRTFYYCFIAFFLVLSVEAYAQPSSPTGISGTMTICEGSSTTLSVQGGVGTQYWYTGSCGGTFIGTGSSISVNPTASTIYYVRNYSGGQFSTSCAFGFVFVNSAPQITFIDSSNASCYGASDGTAKASPSGGSAPYSYAWSTGSTADSISGLSAGTYTVTVTDNNGCTSSNSITIASPSQIIISFSGSSSTCYNTANGSATALASGGSGSGYTYSWSTGDTTASISGLAAGTYTVTATDSTGCSDTASYTITAATVVTAPSFTSDSVTICTGSSTTITANQAGSGGGTYLQTTSTSCSYVSGGNISFSFTSATPPAGNGTLTAYYNGDLNSSSSEYVAYYGEGSYIGNSNATSQCGTGYGFKNFTISQSLLTSWAADGTISILADASSGVGAFCTSNSSHCGYLRLTYPTFAGTTYWFADSFAANTSLAIDSGTTLTASPTTTTTYYIANYENGCWSTTDSIVVVVAPIPNVGVSAGSDTICNGSSTTLTASGALTYAWSPTTGLSSSTGQSVTASPTSSISYIVQGTDANGCTDTSLVSLVVDPGPSLTATPTSTTCFGGNDGSATVTETGNAPYSYAWSSGGTAATETGLTAGAYTVTVTDVNGCTNAAMTTVTEPTQVSGTVSANATTCVYNTDGQATISATGGSGSGYSYQWSTGDTTQILTGLSAATYTVTVTDGSGCTGTVSGAVSSATVVTAPTFTADTVTLCAGSSTTITANQGGSGSNSYSQTTSTSCSYVTGGNITLTFTSTPVPSGNGTLTAYYLGDLNSGEYVAYYGEGSSYIGQSNLVGQCASVYSSKTFTISQSQLTSWAGDGSISILADANSNVNDICAGGASHCEYLSLTYPTVSGTTYWFVDSFPANTSLAIDSGTTLSASPSVTTTYYIANYENGCWSTVDSIVVNVVALPVVTASTANDTICNGTSTTLTASGASTYAWSPSTGLSSTIGQSVTASPTSSTNYIVLGTDGNGCTDTSLVSLTVDPGPTLTMTPSAALCYGASDGAALVTPSGNSPYTYAWSNGSTADTANSLSAGTYTVTVTDANTCTNSASTTITQPAQIFGTVSTNATSCAYTTDGQATVSPSGGSGSGYTYMWSNGDTTQIVTGLSAGTYTVTVIDGNGCTGTASGTVSSATVVTAPTFSSDTVTLCTGSSTTITANQSGSGNGTYLQTTSVSCSYTDGGVISFTFNSTTPPSGNGTLTAYYRGDLDAGTSEAIYYYGEGNYIGISNNTTQCASGYSSKNFTISQSLLNTWSSNGSISITADAANGVNSFCTGNSSHCGYLRLTYPTFAGTTYWFADSFSTNTSLAIDSGASLSASPTTTTTYYIANYENGCWSTVDSIVVDVVALPVVTASAANDTICNGTSTTLSASGASTYQWSPSTGLSSTVGQSVTASPTSSTNYIVLGTDGNGCTDTSLVSLTVDAGPSLSISASPASCYGSNDGTAWVAATGNSPYTYSWSSGSTIDTSSSLTAGFYTVTVTDNNTCTNAISTYVGQPSQISGTVSTNPATCHYSTNGQAVVSASGGTSGYTYSWSNGATSQVATGLASGTFTVTITDANNCIDSASGTVGVTNNVSSPVISTSSPTICNGDSAALTATQFGGGTANYLQTTGYGYSYTTGGFFNRTFTNAPATASGNGTLTVYYFGDFGSSNENVAVYGEGNAYLGTTFGNSECGSTLSQSFTISQAQLNSWASDGIITIELDASSAVNTGVCASYSFRAYATLSYPAQSGSGYWFAGNFSGSTATTAQAIDSMTSISVAPSTTTTYYVSNYDNGCWSIADSVDVSVDTLPSIAISGNTSICDGASTALTASGAQSYSWTPSSSLNTSTGSSVTASPTSTSTYTILGTDGNGCSDSANYTLTVNTLPSLTTSFTEPSCNGLSDGTATVSASGNSPYTYVWTTSATTSTATGLSAGTYIVTVTDNNSCTSSNAVVVSEPAVVSGSISITDASCWYNADGQASVSGTGGDGSYTYAWSNAGTAQSISGLATGTYTVTVTDGNGCTGVITDAVSAPAPLSTPTIYSADTTFCNTSATITLSGSGTSTYWFEGSAVQDNSQAVDSGSTASVTPATSTNYYYGVYDGTCWSDFDSMSVTLLTLPTVSASGAASEVCLGNGTTLTASGANTYAWSPASSLSASTGSTVTAAPTTNTLYTVTGTDGNGCENTDTVSVNIAPAPITSLSSTTFNGFNIDCNGDSTGSITSSTGNGISPYTYNWSGPSGFSASSANVSNLVAGSYSVIVTGDNGCMDTASITLTEPTSIALSSTASSYNGYEISCKDATDGSVDLTASGGVSPYSYSWTGPGSFTSTSEDPSGLEAGTYYVTVTDDNGCSATDSMVLTEPDSLLVSLTPSSFIGGFNLSCFDSGDGTVSTSVSGGVAAYSYSWTGPSSYTASSDSISTLDSGSYFMTVTDNNGCTVTDFITLTQPTALASSGSLSDYNGSSVTCNGASDGSIDLTAAGGVTGYAYSWSGPGSFTSSAEDITSLEAGQYIAQITDTNGCVLYDTFNLTEPAALSLTINATDVTCFMGQGTTGNDGALATVVAGGTPSYTYTWSTADTTSGMNSLAMGTYSLTVQDTNGCMISDSSTVNFVNTLPQPDLGADTSLCDLDTLVVDAGNYVAYNWSTSDTTQTVSLTQTGGYAVTVTDLNTCFGIDSIHATFDTLPVISLGNTSASCGPFSLTPGSNYVSYDWNTGDTTASVTAQASGMYTVTVVDANGCSSSADLDVTIYPTVSAQVTTQDAECGESNGSATASAASGTSPFTYAWSNSGTGATISNLAAAVYTVTITDDNGCTASESAAVGTVDAPTVSLSSTDLLCSGDQNGTASASISGGTTPYTVTWSNGSIDNNISGLSGGTYTITVLDATGCVEIASVDIFEPTALVGTSSSNEANCGIANGSAEVFITGGTTPYTYLWNDSLNQTTSAASNLAAGAYLVTITDSNGCELTKAVTVSNIGAPDLSISVTNTTCPDGSDGSLTVTATGGVTPYTYLWNDAGAQTTATASGLTEGEYAVEVTDSAGCIAAQSATVSHDNENPTVDLGPDVAVDASTLPILLDAGSGFNAYLWQDNSTQSTFSATTSGQYWVQVEDNNGCIGSDSIQIRTWTVGIAGLTETVEIAVYPNPSSGLLNIEFGSPVSDAVDFEVYSASGRFVTSKRVLPGQVQGQTEQIDLSGQAKGVYLLKVQVDGRQVVKRISIM